MEAEVRRLFYKSLKHLAEYEGVKVAWPNKAFNDKQIVNGKELDLYLRASVMPVDPRVLTLCDGGSEYKWLLQVSIYTIEGHSRGEFAAIELVDKLRAAYPVNTKLTGVEHIYKIITPANPAPSVKVSGWCFIPVRFRLQVIC